MMKLAFVRCAGRTRRSHTSRYKQPPALAEQFSRVAVLGVNRFAAADRVSESARRTLRLIQFNQVGRDEDVRCADAIADEPSRIGLLEDQDRANERRLSRAGVTDDDERLTAVDVRRNVIETFPIIASLTFILATLAAHDVCHRRRSGERTS